MTTSGREGWPRRRKQARRVEPARVHHSPPGHARSGAASFSLTMLPALTVAVVEWSRRRKA